MKKKHYPGNNRKTLCGHEATKQEYLQMVRGHNVTCMTCKKLFKINKKKKIMVVQEIGKRTSYQYA
tara:strand:- start:1595 stop:1792 length:198 start_codon:yes stop_codon:yes gene_type:complete